MSGMAGSPKSLRGSPQSKEETAPRLPALLPPPPPAPAAGISGAGRPLMVIGGTPGVGLAVSVSRGAAEMRFLKARDSQSWERS